MKISLKRNLVLGFGVSLLLLIISSIASLVSIHNLFSSSAWVNHTHLVVESLEKALADIEKAEAGQRGFLITGQQDFMEHYGKALELMMSNNSETPRPKTRFRFNEIFMAENRI